MKHCILFSDMSYSYWIRRSSGIYRVATIMRELDWKVDTIDFVSKWDFSTLTEGLDRIITDDTKFFGFSSNFTLFGVYSKLIEYLKTKYPDKKFIAGGQREHNLNAGMDVYLHGFSEVSLPLTLDWLFNNGPAPRFLKQTNNAVLIDGYDHYPANNYDSYVVNYQQDDCIQPYEVLTIEIARGCPFKCKFCSFPYIGMKNIKNVTKENLRNELNENYEKYRIKNYILADDTFNDRNEKIELLAEIVDSLSFKPNFGAMMRIELLATRPEQIELLQKARVWAHCYGIESFTREAAAAMGKGMDPLLIKETLLTIKEKFNKNLGLYRGTISLIAGLPFETPDNWQETQEWLLANWQDNSWYWFPLAIYKTKIEDSKNRSFLMDYWQNYDYEVMEDTENMESVLLSDVFPHIKKFLNNIDNIPKITLNKEKTYSPNMLRWKNQYIDYVSVLEWCMNYYLRLENKLWWFHILEFTDQYTRKELVELDYRWYYKQQPEKTYLIDPYLKSKATYLYG